jgi:hypothetical protein
LSALFLLFTLIGGALWGAFLIGLHFLFTRLDRPRLAAGAVYRARLNKHVYRRSL